MLGCGLIRVTERRLIYSELDEYGRLCVRSSKTACHRTAGRGHDFNGLRTAEGDGKGTRSRRCCIEGVVVPRIRRLCNTGFLCTSYSHKTVACT